MPSHIDWLREFCLSLPHTTERIQWQHDLLFCVGQKMFCVANLEPALSPGRFAFKCTPEKFAELIEIEGIVPAPYMARNHWISFVDESALRHPEIRALIRESYRMVFEKLPKRVQAKLSGEGQRPAGKRTEKKSARPAKRRAAKRKR